MRGGPRTRRVLRGVLAAVPLAGLLTLAGPGTGAARAAALCSGHLARTLRFATGEVRVYDSGDYVCGVTLAASAGPRRAMSLTVQARGSRPAHDSGRYVHHAGPLTVHAGHRCVRVTGGVAGSTTASGWILC